MLPPSAHTGLIWLRPGSSHQRSLESLHWHGAIPARSLACHRHRHRGCLNSARAMPVNDRIVRMGMTPTDFLVTFGKRFSVRLPRWNWPSDAKHFSSLSRTPANSQRACCRRRMVGGGRRYRIGLCKRPSHGRPGNLPLRRHRDGPSRGTITSHSCADRPEPLDRIPSRKDVEGPNISYSSGSIELGPASPCGTRSRTIIADFQPILIARGKPIASRDQQGCRCSPLICDPNFRDRDLRTVEVAAAL